MSRSSDRWGGLCNQPGHAFARPIGDLCPKVFHLAPPSPVHMGKATSQRAGLLIIKHVCAHACRYVLGTAQLSWRTPRRGEQGSSLSEQSSARISKRVVAPESRRPSKVD